MNMQLMMKLMMINHGVRTGQEEEMVMQQLGKEVVKVGKEMEEEKVQTSPASSSSLAVVKV